MKQYLDSLRLVLSLGNFRGDRTGTGTQSYFGHQIRYNLVDGFPLVTTKKVFTRGIIEELLWILRGSTNNKELTDKNVHIWDEWAWNNKLPLTVDYRRALLEEALKEKFSEPPAVPYFSTHGGLDTWIGNYLRDNSRISLPMIPTHVEDPCNGELGPIYGKQWRSWLGHPKARFVDGKPEVYRDVVDQISQLIEGLKNKPFSRRHVVSAWNPSDLPDESVSPQENVKECRMALAPCHCLFQFYVREANVDDRCNWLLSQGKDAPLNDVKDPAVFLTLLDELGAPEYMLDCQLYQR